MKFNIPENYMGSVLTYGLVEEYLQNCLTNKFEYKQIREDEYSWLEGFYIPVIENNDFIGNHGIFIHLMDEQVHIFAIKLIKKENYKRCFFKEIKDYNIIKLFDSSTFKILINVVKSAIDELTYMETDIISNKVEKIKMNEYFNKHHC